MHESQRCGGVRGDLQVGVSLVGEFGIGCVCVCGGGGGGFSQVQLFLSAPRGGSGDCCLHMR